MKSTLCLVLSATLTGCATESIEEPEATVATPGAFVAVDTPSSPMSLLRTLDSFKNGDDTILVFTEYNVIPDSWEEAEAMAKLPDLPIRYLETPGSFNTFTQFDHRVVWYRTLTDEERERAQ
ncbi:MAG: hypothetical protein IPK82_13405 [Polyangiaceae bacterium]|nr:hypothetical protein [Polyangiaceae bacterium]